MITMASDLVKNCKGLSGLSDCKCCCFENLLLLNALVQVTLRCPIFCKNIRKC